MDIKLDELVKVFNAIKFRKRKGEDNFFALGSRSFYENPFTEVLAYILSSESQYSYRNLFIEILLNEAVNDNNHRASLIKLAKTSTQYCTRNHNYIDLILYNDECIVVFENKIFHHANNPFDDYVKDIEKSYPNHKKYYILLSYKKQEASDKSWIYTSIPEKFDAILSKHPKEFINKWDYFIFDFLKHFTLKKIDMTGDEKKFYETNFHKIIAAGNMLNEYINDIAKNFAEENEVKYQVSSNWDGETKAVRFYPVTGQSNVALIFTMGGEFSIFIYYYKDYSQFLEEIYSNVGKDTYCEWTEGKICCFALKNISYKKLEEALLECKLQIDKMKDYFTTIE